ncbi:MAG: translation initiation factor [Zetaproteobacteria bacterium CG_4_9_14_3_um_filter_53_7]|nr:MAG: translation initiation factor [Zetaproteobacteria bacterium CG_4_9_14_3_um_filter_53_7]
MNDNHRLVYSTEQGSLDKPMQKSSSAGKKKTKSAAPVIKNPNKQGVRIRRESKGRGGKTVCIVDGLQLDDNGLKTLLKTLKAQLGTGGAVKEGCLEIQGDHRDKLLQLLEKEGIKARLAGG